MFKIVLMVVLAAVAVVLVLAAMKPDSFHVERTATIKAPAAQIFGFIDDFHRWPVWSPYENRDPAMKRTYSGAASGTGAVYEWDGNNDVGAGRMEILESSAPSKVKIKLDFLRPFEGHNLAEFTLQPEGDATRVTWSMSGPAPFVSKLMQVFVNFDNMIGKDFESGLSNLQTITED